MAFGKKNTPSEEENTSMDMSHHDETYCADCCAPQENGSFGRKIMYTLVGVLIVYLTFYVGTLMRNSIKEYDYIGQSDQMERMITVNGLGKASGRNDIAMTTIGFSNVNKDIATAQKDNSKVMDAVMNDLKALGIEEKDMVSDYNVYPDYNYTQEGGQELRGYRVTQNVTVKVRDLTKIPNVLALAGKHGANQVNGLTFTIDDTENLKNEARDKAMADAKEKAMKLAESLGVRLVEVVSYNEYEGGGGYDYAPMYKEGMGGAGVPTISSGSRDVIMNVNVTYKIATR